MTVPAVLVKRKIEPLYQQKGMAAVVLVNE